MADDMLFIGIGIALLVALLLAKRKPQIAVAGRSEVKETDWASYTICDQTMRRPMWMDCDSYKLYKMVAYRLITPSPQRKYSCLMEPFGWVPSDTKQKIFPLELEQGINEPVPTDALECAVPDPPGTWLFSWSGNPQEASPIAQKQMETKNREIAQLTDTLRQSQAEVDHKVKDKINLIGKFQRGLSPPPYQPPMG